MSNKIAIEYDPWSILAGAVKQQDLKWKAVAAQAAMSESKLRALRSGSSIYVLHDHEKDALARTVGKETKEIWPEYESSGSEAEL